MALPQESRGLLEAAGAHLLYTGVGKVNAAAAFTLPTPVYKSGAPAASSSPRDSCGNAMTIKGLVWGMRLG